MQTDAFLDRPPSPLFIPQSTGKDIATQIEAGDVTILFSPELEFEENVLVIRFRFGSEAHRGNSGG